MPWYSGIIVIFFLFIGCANNQPQIGKKSFQNEDELIIKGLMLEDNNDLSDAVNIFQTLYTKTNKYVYLKEIIKLKFYEKKYKETIILVDKFNKKYPDKIDAVLDFKIYSYINLKQLNTALHIAKSYLQQKRNLDIYKLIAYIYIQKKDYNKAIKYLKSAYSISHSSKVLAQMGDLFFKYLKKPNEAISYYQTHIRLYGCEELICNRLANIYKFLYDYDNLIEIYKKMFKSSGNIEYGRKIVYLYLELEEYNKAIEFIKNNKLNEKLLYLVYKTRLDKKHTYKDAYKLYKITHKEKYLFLYSIYKFDNSEKGLLDLKNLIANLENVIKGDRNPIYLNYLGYVLIDYNINPKKGIELVNEALSENPESPEFLDSLAWGYYKLKQCKKAYEIIEKINSEDEDIEKHKKIIRRCYDIRKNHK